MPKRKTTVRRHRIHPVMFVILGGVVLIGAVWALLASHAYYPAPSVTATANNDAEYSVLLKWSSSYYSGGYYSSPYWHITYSYSGSGTSNVYVSGQSQYTYTGNGCYQYNCAYTLKNLVCGQNYTFSVTGVQSNYSNSPTTGTGSAHASAECPTPSITSLSAKGKTVNVSWSAPSFVSTFSVEANTGSGYRDVSDVSGSSSASFDESCGQNVSVYIVGKAGNQSSNSGVSTTPTAACSPTVTPTPTPSKSPTSTPTPTPTPTPGSGGGSGGSGGSGSGGGSSGGGTRRTTNGTPAPIVAAVPQGPAAPTDFQASVAAGRIVELSWTPSVATSPISAYQLDRSTDDISWDSLTNANSTNYEDDATDYGTLYYYRVAAVDSAGKVSDYATTQIKTTKFQSTGQHITSADGVVSATIANNTFNEETECSIIKYSGTAPAKLTNNSKLLLGPYDLLCVGQDGNRLTSFNQSVAVTAKLGSQAQGHTNFSVQNLVNSQAAGSSIANLATKPLSSTYQATAKSIAFKLTRAQPFGVYGQTKHSLAGIILGCFFAALLLAGLTIGFRFLQNRVIAAHDAAVLTGQPGQELLTQALNKPDCTHVGLTHQVQPMTTGCQECMANGTQWHALRICLTCGHVGCSDDSPYHHAHDHFAQTGHPIIMAYNEPAAANIGWCYIDQTYV